MPKASTWRPNQRDRAGIAKTSPASRCGGICSNGTAPVNTTRWPHAQRSRHPPEPLPIGPVADDEQPGVGKGLEHLAPQRDQRVLALAAHETPRADHHRRRGRDAQLRAHLRSPAARAEALTVHLDDVAAEPRSGRRAQRRRDAVAAVLTDVGEVVGAVADPPEQLSGAGERSPPDLVPVRQGLDVLSTRVAQGGAEKPERCAGPEDDPVAVVASEGLDDSPSDRRCRQQHPRGVAHHRVGQSSVERTISGGRRRVDDHPVGRQVARTAGAPTSRCHRGGAGSRW